MDTDKLEARLLEIHKRVQWIADEELRSAWVKGWAAQGALDPERTRLLDEAENILDQLSGRKRA